MELYNIRTKEFKSTGHSVIQQSKEVLILVRYPFQAGNRDFLLLKSGHEFEEFLSSRKPKESVTIFKDFQTLKEGTITESFIDETLTQLSPKSSGWVVIFPEQQKQKATNWRYAETKTEMRETLRNHLGRIVKILEEPDWFDESSVVHGFEPDEDGQIRPGAY